ncbi:MAG: VOC family protein, partial [Micrococcales bacterium]
MSKPAQLKTFLWFDGGLGEALAFYQSTFKDVVVHSRTPGADGQLFTADFSIFGHEFIGMNAPGGPKFNDSISLSINCDGQDEVDRLWEAITSEGKAG